MTKEQIKRYLDVAAGTLAQAAAAMERGDASAAETSLSALAGQIGALRLVNAQGQSWERMVTDRVLKGGAS